MNLEVVLFAPEIPQNTGSIGRLCVNLGLRLHLIEPLGFSLEEKMLRRAGLDYWAHLDVHVHASWAHFVESIGLESIGPDSVGLDSVGLDSIGPRRMWFASTKTDDRDLYEVEFESDDVLVFGRETDGLPPEFYQTYRQNLFRIPMPGAHHRSLNLSNAVAITVYEAYRQLR